jgi:hypothetical protein
LGWFLVTVLNMCFRRIETARWDTLRAYNRMSRARIGAAPGFLFRCDNLDF